MISVKFDILNLELTVNGHAGARKVENIDPVCLAASTIAQGLLYQALLHSEKGKIRYDADCKVYCEKVEHTERKGYLHLKITPTVQGEAQMRCRFIACLESLDMLAVNFPESFTNKRILKRCS